MTAFTLSTASERERLNGRPLYEARLTGETAEELDEAYRSMRETAFGPSPEREAFLLASRFVGRTLWAIDENRREPRP